MRTFTLSDSTCTQWDVSVPSTVQLLEFDKREYICSRGTSTNQCSYHKELLCVPTIPNNWRLSINSIRSKCITMTLHSVVCSAVPATEYN